MRWTVEKTIIYSSSRRRLDDQNHIWVGSRVRFTLRLVPDPNTTDGELQDMHRDARQAPNWREEPKLVVTGQDRDGRPVPILVRHRPSNTIQFDYHFRYRGTKQLVFSGRPREVTPPTNAPSQTSITLFPPLRYETELVVVGTQQGQDAASRQGTSSRGFSQGERAREDEQERIARSERAAEQTRRRDMEHRESTATARQTDAFSIATPQESNAIRNGRLTFELKTDREIRRLLVLAANEYFLNLQAAINVTRPLDLRSPNWRRSSAGRFLEEINNWQAEQRDDGRIEVWQRRSYRSTLPQRDAHGIRHRRVPSPHNHNRMLFPADSWIVARIPGHSGKALLPAAELPGYIRAERWARLATILDQLDPTTAAENFIIQTFEQLTGVRVPPEAILAGQAALIVLGIVNGLRRVATTAATTAVRASARRAFRSPSLRTRRVLPSSSARRGGSGRSTTSSRIDPVTRGTAPESRGLDAGGSGGGEPRNPPDPPEPPRPRREPDEEGLGRRRPRYRGPERPVTGRIDSVIRSEGLIQDASPGELMAAETFGRNGREVVILPETEDGWRQLAFQPGWSRRRRDRLRWQLAEAVRRDRLDPNRDPDLLINSRVWDVLAPDTIRGGNTLNERALTSIFQGIWAKGQSRQTRRVAYVANGFQEDLSEIRAVLRQHIGSTSSPFGSHIDEVVLIQDGRLLEIYSRGRGISP